MPRELSDRRWRTYRQHLLHTLPPICALCAQPIHLTLKGTHPDGPTIDHITPRSKGGPTYDRTNIQLAHQHCNSARRNDPLQQRTTRDW